jgi:SAM-dependent methyltransferase
MDRYDPDTYGEQIADLYDEWYGGMDPAAAVDLLGSLARRGPVLELGVGTGRVAIPLSERGLEVHGIDASPAMVERLRAKAGGDRIGVTFGDLADVPVDRSFSLVFVVFNTLFALPTQDAQVRCFGNVARRLVPGGFFLLECFVPDPARFDEHQRVSVFGIDVDQVRLNLARHRPAEQRVDSQHVLITEDGTRLVPVALRYAWPSELDLMARLAGLRLRHRWGGWRREPYDDDSRAHVSVYEKPPAPEVPSGH